MGRTTIPVFKETYEKLLKVKLKKQSELGRKITWDEFFIQLLGDAHGK